MRSQRLMEKRFSRCTPVAALLILTGDGDSRRARKCDPRAKRTARPNVDKPNPIQGILYDACALTSHASWMLNKINTSIFTKPIELRALHFVAEPINKLEL